MADVFLSYAREDAARAEQIARGLEAAGLDVFWDNEIPPGQTWADYIEQKLTQCKALIVLWSEHSTKSQWVREEARMGRDKSVLIPVLIDNVQPPFGFGEVQAANLSSWQGAPEDPKWLRFVDAVTNFARAAPTPAAAPQAAPTPRWTSPAPSASAAPTKKSVPVWVWIVGAVVATIVVLGVIGMMLPDDPPQHAGPPQDPQALVQTSPGQNVYQQQILQQLSDVEHALAAQGFQRMAQPITGQLPAGQHQNWPMTLEMGGDYRLIAVCDNDCGNIDLMVYDENNVLVAQDVLPDATPVATIAPRWTGSFTVQAVMQHCTVQPCYYALVLYGRPLP
jgi:hypothetical protein